jgi:hypothetical protein
VIVKIMQVNAKRILIWTRTDLTYSEKLNFKDSIYIYIYISSNYSFFCLSIYQHSDFLLSIKKTKVNIFA